MKLNKWCHMPDMLTKHCVLQFHWVSWFGARAHKHAHNTRFQYNFCVCQWRNCISLHHKLFFHIIFFHFISFHMHCSVSALLYLCCMEIAIFILTSHLFRRWCCSSERVNCMQFTIVGNFIFTYVFCVYIYSLAVDLQFSQSFRYLFSICTLWKFCWY